MKLKTVFWFGSAFLCLLGTSLAKTIGGNVSPFDVNLTTAQKKAYLERHDHAFQALAERIRDPFVTLGPDGYYYVTGTTAGSHWGEQIGIRVWRSENLAEWEDLGFVWDLHKDGKAQGSWHFEQPIRNPQFKNPYAVWAPEIHYLNGTWWIPHCLNVGGHGLLKSTSGKPEGPYIALDPIQRTQIDSHLFQEADGTTYYCYQADYIAKMDEDMEKIVEDFHKLEHDGNHPLGYEGVLILKIEDFYLHIASGRYGYEPTNTYDLFYAVSKELYGPYGERRKMIKRAGHGNLFQDKQGRWWSTAFDHQMTDEWSLWLVPIEIEITEDDVLVHVKDERFRPDAEDEEVVRKLSKSGIPEKWKNKVPWWRPE